jgi:microcystin-dependent protein
VTQPFIGQVQSFGFNFAPRNWAFCNGQTLAINQNQALFALLGVTYGGNGSTTFQLPNLQSRVPMHQGTYLGNTYVPGQMAGEENVTLLTSNLPQHTHQFSGTNAQANSSAVSANGYALAAIVNQDGGTAGNYYGPANSTVTLNPAEIGNTGGSQPHPNIQPYLAINWCIALYGIFPSRN